MKKKKSPKKNVYQNIRETVHQYIFGKNYSPIDKNQIISKLEIAKKYFHIVYKVLDDLLTEGIIVRSAVGYLPTNLQEKSIVGTVSVHHKGFGFVQPENAPAQTKDIFIPKHQMNDAIDGDKVQVAIFPIVSAKGPEGKIIKIIERKRASLIGIISAKAGKNYTAFSPILGPAKQILVLTPKNQPKIGDRVLLKIEQWQKKDQMIQAKISKNFGSIEDSSIDIEIAIEEHKLLSEFSEKSLGGIPTKIGKNDLKIGRAHV